jgi:phospholipid transport system substrate-binding protein
MLFSKAVSMLAAIAVGAFALVAPAPSAASVEPPHTLIERIGSEMLERIKADPAVKGGDFDKLSALVDELVMPHVNFQRMTALAAGRWWRQASPEQQKQLMNEFRVMLLRTYSGALAAVDDQSIRMRPLRAADDATDVIVRSEIVQPRGEPIQLDYRMQKLENAWKIYDVNVLGVWLIETYRTQFNQEAARTGVEGLIRSLADKNREFVAGKKS